LIGIYGVSNSSKGTMRSAKFNIEIYGDKTFNGYTDDEEWNGWSCPYFTFEESKKIVAAHHTPFQKAGYDETSDVFYFQIQDEYEYFRPIEIEGKKLYPIGTSSWIWEELQ
jgi:hypothetical protein